MQSTMRTIVAYIEWVSGVASVLDGAVLTSTVETGLRGQHISARCSAREDIARAQKARETAQSVGPAQRGGDPYDDREAQG